MNCNLQEVAVRLKRIVLSKKSFNLTFGAFFIVNLFCGCGIGDEVKAYYVKETNLAANTANVIRFCEEENWEEAYKLAPKADPRDEVFLYYMGIMYANGLGGACKDGTEAWNYFHRSALLGYAMAQYKLACIYADDNSVWPDENEAVRWFTEAAKQGHEGAQNELKKRNINWE